MEDVDQGRCCRVRCHEVSDVIYLDEPLCQQHWEEVCAADERREALELEELFNDDPVLWGLLS